MTMPSDDDLDFAADLEAELGPQQKPQGEEIEVEQQALEEERLYRRDGRRFVAKEDEKAAKDAAPEAEQQPQQAAPKAWRPTWYKNEYGDWDKLPENFRNALRDQERNAAQGIEKHATAAKVWEPLTKQLEPMRHQLAAQGQTEQQFLGGLVNIYSYLQQDPVNAINWLCQQTMSTDIYSLVQWMQQQGHQPEQVDPRDRKLQELEQKVQNFERQGVNAQREATNRHIADWAKDKPDFEAVKPIMAALANQNPQASLDDLYREAQWAHPEIRERILAEREDKRQQELRGKRRAGAQTPRGTPTPNGQPRIQRNKTWDIESDLKEAFDEAGIN